VYSTGAVTGGTASNVTFTASAVGVKTDAIYSAGSTGATGTMSTTTQGVDADTTTSVATKIRGTTFSGWTTGGTGTTVTFTATAGGTKTAPTYSAGSTGTTGTMSVTTIGVDADGKWYYWNGSAWTAGVVYQSSGIGQGAVTQTNLANDLLSILSSKPSINLGAPTNGYYKADGVLQSITTYKCFQYSVSPNEIYYISGSIYLSPTAMIRYADANGVVLSSQFVGGDTAQAYTDQTITIPANCTKLLLTFYTEHGETYSLSKSSLINVNNKVGNGTTAKSYDIADEAILFSKLSTLEPASYKRVPVTFNNGYYKSDGTYSALGAYRCCTVNCQEGDVFLYKAYNILGNTVYTVILKDSNGNVLKLIHLGTNTPETVNLKINIPANCTQALFNFRYDADASNNYEAQVNYGLFKYTFTESQVNFWGDSLTYGNQDGSGVTYPTVLSTLLGSRFNAYYNCGVGGEAINQIGGRQGGLPLFVDPFTIPSDNVTPVVISIKSVDGDPVKLSMQPVLNSLNPVVINGVAGNITYDSTSSVNKFIRLRTNASVTLTRPTIIITQGSAQFNDGINIIWAGTNDQLDSSIVNEAIHKIKSMIEYANSKKYIIIGLTAKSYMPDVANVNKTLSHAFGRHFLDIRSYILQYGLQDAGITATTQDNTDIANGEIPSSLRNDGIHLNQKGYNVVANQVYQKGLELGYWN
jgi:lysophospholipase L1-like esterase